MSCHINKLSVIFVLILALMLTGFTVIDRVEPDLPPNTGPNFGGEQPAEAEVVSSKPINLIKNGSFEERDADDPDKAVGWEHYTNGRAVFGFYDETWPEAVYKGEYAQLMEINQVEANVLDRVIAIHQTMDVVPYTIYNLKVHAIMRTQTHAADRNKHEVEMHWGIDPSGQGNYDNVQEWHILPLEEQYRLGSTGEYPEDIPLRYEIVEDSFETPDTNRITLFIRGLKKFPTGTEVNFDLDELSLVGPPPGSKPATPPVEPPDQSEIPDTGIVLPSNSSLVTVLLAALVLLGLGIAAANNLFES